MSRVPRILWLPTTMYGFLDHDLYLSRYFFLLKKDLQINKGFRSVNRHSSRWRRVRRVLVRSITRRTLCAVDADAAPTISKRRLAHHAATPAREKGLTRWVLIEIVLLPSVVNTFFSSRCNSFPSFIRTLAFPFHYLPPRPSPLISSPPLITVVREVPPSPHDRHRPSSPLEGGQPQIPQWIPRGDAA